MVAVWGMFVSGLLLLGYALFGLYAGMASGSWPLVPGRIVHSEVIVGKGPRRGGTSHLPIIVYEYTVQGNKRTSRRIGNYIGFDGDAEKAEALVGRFPAGSQAPVYHHPRIAALTALVPGMQQPLAHFLLGFTGAMTALGASAPLFADDPYAFVNVLFGVFGSG